MEQARDWLPDTAFTEEIVGQVLRDSISSWSKRWFADAQVDVAAVRLGHVNKRMAQGLHVQGRSCEAELSGRGKRALLEAALGVDLSGMTLTESDHRILDRFAMAAADDLVAALDSLGDGAREGSILSATLSLAGVEMAVLELPAAFLIPQIRKNSGPARKPAHPPKSRSEALRLVPIKAEGYLGRAELTLDDLQGLAIGDVIVLENSLKDPVELRMPGGRQCIGRGKLVRTVESVSIQF